MDKVRIRYSKTDRARYISHLDLATTFQRSLIRAGVKLKYSEGFNPHPYISVALPLSVGSESLCELMDVGVQCGIPDDINDYLPDGLHVLGLHKPLHKFALIKWVRVCCNLLYEENIADNVPEILKERFSAKSLIILKKTKSGVSDIDIAKYICNAQIFQIGRNEIKIDAVISAQQPTVSNNDIQNIVCFDSIISSSVQINVKRIEIFDKDMVLFR